MFHIFDNIIVAPDIFATGGIHNNNIVISSFKDYDFSKWPDVIQLFTSDGYFEHYSKSYESMVGSDKKFENDLAFFEYLFNNRKKNYAIFADSESYAKTVIKTLKLLFPNIDSETGYLIYKLSLDYFYSFFHFFKYQTESVELISNHLRYKDVVKKNRDEFVNLFDNIIFEGDVEQLKEQLIPYISTEYKIVNYISGGKVDIESLHDTCRKFFTSQLYVLYRDLQRLEILKSFSRVNNNFEADFNSIVESMIYQWQATDHKRRVENDIKQTLTNHVLFDQTVFDQMIAETFFLSKDGSGRALFDHFKNLFDLIEKDNLDEYINFLSTYVNSHGFIPYMEMRMDGLNPFLLTYVLLHSSSKKTTDALAL